MTSNKASITRKRDKARLTKVTLKIPFDIGSFEWTPDNVERDAAWCLYVELVTRIAVQPLPDNAGLLREALSSLYTLFESTRQILRDSGPDVGGVMPSVGGIAIGVLNKGLRPFLSVWHCELLDWESQRPANVSQRKHEAQWGRASELRNELQSLRLQLGDYAKVLAEIAGVSQ